MTPTQFFKLVFDVLLRCPETEAADKIKCIFGQEEDKNGNENAYTNLGLFKMPLHYPGYKKGDYEKMEEWKLDNLLQQYGLAFDGSLEEKRAYATGAFLWPDQL